MFYILGGKRNFVSDPFRKLRGYKMNDELLKETAIVPACQGLLAIIDPAEVRNELAALAVPQEEVKGLESALAASRGSDNTRYSLLETKEREAYLAGATWITRWYKSRRFKPSVVKKPSRQTALLETVVKISKDLQVSVDAYGELPKTIAHMANEYRALEAQKAEVESELGSIRDFLTGWKQRKQSLYHGLVDYCALGDAEKADVHKELAAHFRDDSFIVLLDDEGLRLTLAADLDNDFQSQEKKVAVQYAIATNRHVSVTVQMKDIVSEAKSMKSRLDPARIALNSLFDTYKSLALKARMRSANINLDSAVDAASKRREEAAAVLEAIEKDRQDAKIQEEADGEAEKLVNGAASDYLPTPEEMCAGIDSLLGDKSEKVSSAGCVAFRRK